MLENIPFQSRINTDLYIHKINLNSYLHWTKVKQQIVLTRTRLQHISPSTGFSDWKKQKTYRRSSLLVLYVCKHFKFMVNEVLDLIQHILTPQTLFSTYVFWISVVMDNKTQISKSMSSEALLRLRTTILGTLACCKIIRDDPFR